MQFKQAPSLSCNKIINMITCNDIQPRASYHCNCLRQDYGVIIASKDLLPGHAMPGISKRPNQNFDCRGLGRIFSNVIVALKCHKLPLALSEALESELSKNQGTILNFSGHYEKQLNDFMTSLPRSVKLMNYHYYFNDLLQSFFRLSQKTFVSQSYCSFRFP